MVLLSVEEAGCAVAFGFRPVVGLAPEFDVLVAGHPAVGDRIVVIHLELVATIAAIVGTDGTVEGGRRSELERSTQLDRHATPEMLDQLELGPPGTLDGAVCADDGCDRRHGLEKDHDDPVANGGMTSYENIKLRCKPDHRAKTERERTAGLLGGRADERGPP